MTEPIHIFRIKRQQVQRYFFWSYTLMTALIGAFIFGFGALASPVHNRNAFAMANVQMKLKDWDAAVQSVKGFSVKFNWLGQGVPGSQRYEIIDPATYKTLDAGIIVPEPATMLLIGLGGLLLWKQETIKFMDRTGLNRYNKKI